MTSGPQDHVDGLLEQLLTCAEAGDAEATGRMLAQLCADHPEHAQTLRRRASLLRDLGVLAPTGDAVPERLGPFRLLRSLGQGGMGVVHLAEQVDLGRRVALKVIRPEILYFPGARERFRREVETVARLQHPGIVPIYTVGEEEGVPYFAMELVEGCSLTEVIDEVRRLELEPRQLSGRHLANALERRATGSDGKQAHTNDQGNGQASDHEPGSDTGAWLFAGSWEAACLRIVRLLAEALDHAHRRGVVHRDIKPSNVMITSGESGGQVKLLDFGLASSDSPGRGSLTRSGSRLGSLHYMAPEQARGDGAAVDARTDVYALGVVLYELLTLQRPYSGDSEVQVLAAIERGGAARARTHNPGISWEAETVVLTAMELDSDRRYQSAADLARDLENVLDHRPLEARRAGAGLRALRWVQRNPMTATALTLAAVLLVGVPLLFLYREVQSSSRIREQLQRADTHFARSMDAIDRMLGRVGAVDLEFVPQMESLRVALLEDAVELTEAALRDEIDDDAARARAAASNERLGGLLIQLGRLDEGLAAMERSLDLHDELIGRAAQIDGPALTAARAERADVLGLLAEGFGRAGRLEDAERAHRECDEVLAAAAQLEPTVTDFRLRRALNLRAWGNLLRGQFSGDDEATDEPTVSAWEQALALLDQLAVETPDDVVVHEQLGEVRTAMTQLLLARPSDPVPRPREHALLDAAIESYGRAEALSQDPAQLELRRILAQTVRSNTFRVEGRYDEAERVAREVIPQLEDLVRRFPSTPGYALELATALNQLGNIFDWQRRAADAAQWYGRAVEQLGELVIRFPHLADLRNRAGQGEMNLGVQLMDLGRPQEAATHLARAVELQREALELAPGHRSYAGALRWHHMAHSDALIAAGSFREAADAAAGIVEPLPDDWESHTRAASQTGRVLRAWQASGGNGEAPELHDELVERTVGHLRRALELGFPYGAELHTEATFDALRGEASFDALLEEIGPP